MDTLAGYSALLDYRYWLNPYPVPLGPSLVAQIFAFFAFFVVAAAVLAGVAYYFRKKDELLAGLLRRFAAPTAWTGGLGLLFLFFAYEQSPLLGMRLWFLLIFALFFTRMVFAVAYAVKEFPKLRAERRTKSEFERWIPQPHKR
jgi:hypothetical protein